MRGRYVSPLVLLGVAEIERNAREPPQPAEDKHDAARCTIAASSPRRVLPRPMAPLVLLTAAAGARVVPTHVGDSLTDRYPVDLPVKHHSHA